MEGRHRRCCDDVRRNSGCPSPKLRPPGKRLIFGDDLWLPLLVEQPELLAEVDRFVAHVTPPSFDRQTRALG